MAKKKSSKIAVNKLITCREFKKGIPKEDGAFVFPLPAPMEVGTSVDGSPMIATHCCLIDLDGEGAVQNCFCTVTPENQIVIFSLREAEEHEFSGLKRKSRTREIIN